MAQSVQITTHKRKRASIKAACTRIKIFVDKDSITQLTPALIANLEERKEKLSSYWSDYNSMQFEIESLCDEEGDDRISFEEMFFDLTANLRLDFGV
ncbi:unnamed protein product [Lasius platythorax]|uniref:Uncharacterized protein n=1 Tax=Lasius platythorax TaxID=488582 RepID=A0AAV2MZC8_9HYME